MKPMSYLIALVLGSTIACVASDAISYGIVRFWVWLSKEKEVPEMVLPPCPIQTKTVFETRMSLLYRCQAVKGYEGDLVVICGAVAPYQEAPAIHFCAAHHVSHEAGVDLRISCDEIPA